MKKIVLSVTMVFCFSSIFSQRIINRIFLETLTVNQLDSILGANNIPNIFGNSFDIDVYRLIYNTVNYDSTATTASGMLAVPRNKVCRFPMASYAHGTTTDKHGAPSYLQGQEPVIGMILASIGYVVVEPDYLGLGDGPGMHPYQHAATEASASIDMLRSAREFCDSAGIKRSSQLFLMGYSEGGHASIATHRAIQNQLHGEFTVTASVGMSGAYDMSGVMINRMLSDTPYSQPAYLADLVVSWNPIYHLYDSIQQAFRAPYDTTIPPLLDGTHGTNDLNNAMPSVAKHAFTDSELDTFVNNPNSVMRVALRDNDDYDWTPMCPTRLFFCMADTYVPYLNSVVAINKMKQNGCPDCDTMDVASNLDHVPCAEFSILDAKQFFDNYRLVDCSVDTAADTTVVTTAIQELKNQPIISVYPNPARGLFNIEVYNADQTIAAAMYDATGRKVQDISLHGGLNNVSTEDIATGIYALKITDSNGILKISQVTVEK